jgi:hypothetical protein
LPVFSYRTILMRKLCFIAMLLGWSGCATTEGAAIAFVSPAPGSSHVRDQLGTSGQLVAALGVEVDVSGDVARVAISTGDIALGDTVNDALAAELTYAGSTTLTATAWSATGVELATASVEVMIADPQVAGCRDWLDLYRLQYTAGPAMPGVAEPVTMTSPINGVAYRYSGNAMQRKSLYGDCELMKSLAEAAPIVRAHGVTEIVDFGVYNYRCIDQTKTPPNCTMSQHAYAKAIDIAELVTSDGMRYSVNDDWVIDSTATCTADTSNTKDAFLHEVICDLKAARVWNIVLTPNYNAAHRNHFHVDLTNDSDFIRRSHDEPLDE